MNSVFYYASRFGFKIKKQSVDNVFWILSVFLVTTKVVLHVLELLLLTDGVCFRWECSRHGWRVGAIRPNQRGGCFVFKKTHIVRTCVHVCRRPNMCGWYWPLTLLHTLQRTHTFPLKPWRTICTFTVHLCPLTGHADPPTLISFGHFISL